LDGLPLTNASIYFESDATKTSIVSTLGPDGEFEVQTHAAKGLPPGTYKVAITPGAVLDPAAPPVLAGQKAPKSAELPNIPEKYRTTATSGLSADVREGENAPFSFALVK
jgi:hypothetical protein